MNDNHPPNVNAPPPAKRLEKKDKKREKKAAAVPQAVRSGKAIAIRGSETNAPAAQFTYVLGPQEKALHDYLRCVFNPRDYAARVPNSAGGFELYTQVWRTFENGTMVAGANGVALLGLCANSWVEASNANGVPDGNCQVLGWNQSGAACFRSNSAAANYSAIPQQQSAVQAGWSGVNLDRPTDQAMTLNTRIRLVAMELRLRSTLNSQTAKGEVLLVGSVNPMGGQQGGAINEATWDDIAKTNEEVVTRATRSIANWGSDEVMSIVAIPAEQQAFEMCLVPQNASAGITTFPLVSVAAFARGMTPGDALSYEVCYVWETEMAKSNNASSAQTERPVSVPSSTLSLATANASKYAHLNAVPGMHSLPYIETLAVTQPNAVEALSRLPSLPPTLKTRPSVQTVAHRPSGEAAPGGSFLGRLWTLGKGLLKTGINSGMLMRIPEVGPVVQGVASALSSLLD